VALQERGEAGEKAGDGAWCGSAREGELRQQERGHMVQRCSLLTVGERAHDAAVLATNNRGEGAGRRGGQVAARPHGDSGLWSRGCGRGLMGLELRS
jgi:hypothetical protein